MTEKNNQIILLGMNHRTAPIEIREQLAVLCEAKLTPRELLPRLGCIDEFFLLSTCNRVEFLFTTHQPEQATTQLKDLLKRNLPTPPELLENCLYVYKGLDAVSHIFRVASSLDSMVIGEPQILGQIKEAYREASHSKTLGVILNRLLHKTFSVAKKIRSETRIGSRAVSVSYAAVELARKIFGELSDKQVLLIGAGEMAELAAEHFLAQRVKRLEVANRTFERALELARRFNAVSIPFNHIYDALERVDIVLSSTGSSNPILTYHDIRRRMRQRRNRPLFLIDIAVPRDIDPKVNQIDNVYLYDIDDLQGIVEMNRAERQKQAEQAEHIIQIETLKFGEWLQTLEVVPTIIALRQKAENIRRSELLKTFSHLTSLSEEERRAIEILTESIIKKMLHDPILFLKRADPASKKLYIDLTHQIFHLSGDEGSEAGNLKSFIPVKKGC